MAVDKDRHAEAKFQQALLDELANKEQQEQQSEQLDATQDVASVLSTTQAYLKRELGEIGNHLVQAMTDINGIYTVMTTAMLPLIQTIATVDDNSVGATNNGVQDTSSLDNLASLFNAQQTKVNAVDVDIHDPQGATDFLTAALSMVKCIIDDKNAKKFEKNSELFAKGIEVLTQPIEDLLQTSDTVDNSDRYLNSLANMIKSFAVILGANAKQVDANAKAFAKAIKALTGPITDMIATMDTIEDADRHMTSMSTMFNAFTANIAAMTTALQSAADLFKKFSISIVTTTLSLVAVSAAIIGLVYIINSMDISTIVKFSLAFPVIASAFSLGLLVLGKAMNQKTYDGIMQVSLGIAVLSLAMLMLQFVDIETVAKSIIAFAGVSLVLVATLAIWPNKQIAEFSKSVLYLTASVALLALSMGLFGLIFAETPWPVILKGVAILGISAVAIALVGRALKDGAKDIGIGVLLTSLGLMLLGMALIVFQEQIQNIKLETWLTAGAALLGIAGTVWLIGKEKSTWEGVAMIGALVGALALIPWIAEQYEGIDWETFGKIGAVIGGIVAIFIVAGIAKPAWQGVAMVIAISVSLLLIAVAAEKFQQIEWETFAKIGVTVIALVAVMVAAGFASTMILPGAAALLLGSAALLVLGFALAKWPNEITFETYALIAAGVVTICTAMALIGNPFTLPFILAGIAESAALGLAIYSLGKGLEKAESIDMEKAGNSATALVEWAKKTLSTIASMSLKDMAKASFGLVPYMELGGALANLANAVNLMANGTWKEYDAKGNVIAIHNVGPETYAAFGDAVQQLLDSITEPLAKFGAGGGFFRNSDTENGINALSKIGDIVDPLLSIVKETDKLKKANEAGFAIVFGQALDELINGQLDDKGNRVGGIKGVLEMIGSGSRWYKSNDFEAGIKVMEKISAIVDPVISIADKYETIQKANFADISNAINILLQGDGEKPGLIQIMQGLSKDELKQGVKSFEKLEKIPELLEPIFGLADKTETVKNTNWTELNSGINTLLNGEEGKPGMVQILKSTDPDGLKAGVKAFKQLEKMPELLEPVFGLADKSDIIRDTNWIELNNGLNTLLNGGKGNPGMVQIISGLDDTSITNGVKAFKKLSGIGDTMSDLFNVVTTTGELKKDDVESFNDTMNVVTKQVTAYALAESKMPSTSKFTSDLQVFQQGVKGLDTKNMELLVEAAYAIDSIANANLNKIEKAKSDVSKELFEKLDSIRDELVKVETNTKPVEADTVLHIDKYTGNSPEAFKLEDDTEISIVTIALQLNSIYNLIAANR